MTKPELIAYLKDIADHGGYKPEVSHSNAEGKLLEFINDPEITEAWDEVSAFWWYS